MTEQEAQSHDDRDRALGKALHQRDLSNVVVDRMWTLATQEELIPILPCVEPMESKPEDPTCEEIELWSSWGSLPSGYDGRARTTRRALEWKLHNLTRDIPQQEQRLKDGLV